MWLICSAERGVYFIETHLETMAAKEYGRDKDCKGADSSHTAQLEALG
jgi:hypothetical protein